MPESPGDRLESWKEIAAYLGRGVRTVRRWEADEGLPVHRHMHRALGSVYAFKSEIDLWRRRDRQPAGKRRVLASRDGIESDETKAIAVLPFTNLSADPENAYFADGLAAEIIADLSRVRTLRVISRTSSMAFKGTATSVRTVAGRLGVRYVLEGSVRRAGGRLRIAAQLIDAHADDHVWADTFDGSDADVFAIQERLARMIVGSLKLRLTDAEDRRLGERPVRNLPAYECYLRARHESWRWRKDAIDQAVRLLQNGLAIVGENAGLYTALGLAHLQYREAGIDFTDGPLRAATECARKVRELDGAPADDAQLRGWIHYSSGRIQEAVHDLKDALDADPNNPDSLLLLSNCYLISGRVAAARPLIARLVAVDPLTPVTRCMPAWADILEGNVAAALHPYRQMCEMDPGNPMARLFYVWVLILNQRHDLADRVLADYPPEVRGSVPARIAFFLGRALTGNVSGSDIDVPDIEAAAGATDVFPRFLAQGFALAGMEEPAIHWLEVAVDRGFINYPFLARYDPLFATIRGGQACQRVLAEVRRRWERFEE